MSLKIDNKGIERLIKYYVFYYGQLGKLSTMNTIKNCFFYTYELSNKYQEDNLFYISYKRQDYLDFFNCVYDQCNYQKNFLEISCAQKINFKSILRFLTNFKIIRKIKSISGELNVVKTTTLDLFVIYIKILSLYAEVETIKSADFKNLIVLADVWPKENALVNICNGMGINTVTLQHGLFKDWGLTKSFDVLNYIDIPSKQQLLWGNDTKQLYEKYYKKSQIKVCGNPLWKQKSIEHNNSNKYGIVLDVPDYYKYNQIMIDLMIEYAKEQNGQVIIRKHPADKLEYKFDNKYAVFSADQSECEFIVVYTSTMLISYMAEGIPTLCFKSDIPGLKVDEKITFSNYQELLTAISNIELFDYTNEIKKFVTYTDEESKEKYREFFKSIN